VDDKGNFRHSDCLTYLCSSLRKRAADIQQEADKGFLVLYCTVCDQYMGCEICWHANHSCGCDWRSFTLPVYRILTQRYTAWKHHERIKVSLKN